MASMKLTIAAWIMAAAAASPAPAGGAGDVVRMYARTPADVWREAQALLTELGVTPNKVDAANGVFSSGWINFADEAAAGLRPPALASGLSPSRFQLYLFVPLTVEPGRVAVGSVVSARARGATGSSYAYNTGAVELWFLDRLDHRLGFPGKNAGGDSSARAVLAREVLGRQPSVCVGNESDDAAAAPPADTGVQEPQKLFSVNPWVPKNLAGTVIVDFTVSEDGIVRDVSVRPGADPVLGAAAMGAASQWRYAPPRLSGCTVAAKVTSTMTFKATP